MARRKIIVIGSYNTDMMIAVDHLPQPGETILGGKFHSMAGGKGANQAVSAARAGGDVSLIARLGRDTLGDQALAGFVKDCIHTKYVVRDETNPSGVALILVSKEGQNSIAVASGANDYLSASDVKKTATLFAQASHLVIQLETPLPTVQAAVALATQKGVPVILDPAPGRSLPKSLLRQIAILTPNETEAHILTGIKVTDLKSAARAAKVLVEQGVKAVLLTLGTRGVWVATKEFQRHVPGFKVKATDSTAAGDTFNGALAVALTEGKSLLEAIRFGHAAAALSVTRKGAQASIPSRKEIEAFLDQRG